MKNISFSISARHANPLSLKLLFHLISSQSINLGGRRATTDDVATIPFHPSLFSAALRESPNSIPVHSFMSSSQLFFCRPLLLAPFTVPRQNCLRHARGSWDVAISSEFPFFTMVRRSSWTPVAFCCEPPRSSHGLCRKFSDVSYTILSQGLGLPSVDFCCQGPALRGINEGG